MTQVPAAGQARAVSPDVVPAGHGPVVVDHDAPFQSSSESPIRAVQCVASGQATATRPDWNRSTVAPPTCVVKSCGADQVVPCSVAT